MRFPLLGKAATLGAVALALMAALGAVSGIVNEREGRLREAEQSVMDSLATQQTLVGPVLQRQCEESWDTVQGEDKERRTVRMQRELNMVSLPKQLEMKGHSLQEPRYRGLFKVNAYTLKAQITASWKPGDLHMPSATMPKGVVVCKAPVLWVAVGDARGMRKASLRLNDTEVAVLPGTQQHQHPRGFHAILPAALHATEPSVLTAQLDIDLVGTVQWAIAPVADNNQVTLTSNWPHPSFAGRFLPVQRDVTEQGFTAQWQVSALASSAQQQLIGGGGACRLDGVPATLPGPAAAGSAASCVETMGVNFIDPVSGYVLSDRATKYGLLFIALTFVGVALVEVQRRLRVHPIQYLLVGCALAVFFLLLVSLSEHLPFAAAYAVASIACALLLTFYGRFVLRGTQPGLVFGAAIAALYGALFMLLQLEQSALVLGSVLLFAVLAALMAATRHIDWYAFTAHLRQEEVLAK
jgi:inner membrane protein